MLPGVLGAVFAGYLVHLLDKKPTVPSIHDKLRDIIQDNTKLGNPLYDEELDDQDLSRLYGSVSDLERSEEEKLDKYKELELSEKWQKEMDTYIERLPVQVPESRFYNWDRDSWLVDAPELTPLDPHDLVKWGQIVFASTEEGHYGGVPFDNGGKELLFRDWFRMYGMSIIEAEETVDKGLLPWYMEVLK